MNLGGLGSWKYESEHESIWRNQMAIIFKKDFAKWGFSYNLINDTIASIQISGHSMNIDVV